jgi:hypothetical protein
MPRKSKVAVEESVETKPNQNANIFEWSKRRISSDVEKLNKSKVKLENSVKNHETELKEKNDQLLLIDAQLKELEQLLKQT